MSNSAEDRKSRISWQTENEVKKKGREPREQNQKLTPKKKKYRSKKKSQINISQKYRNQIWTVYDRRT